MIPAVNNHTLPKNCIVNGIPLIMNKLLARKTPFTVYNLCFILRWFDLPAKTTPKNINSVEICRKIFEEITKYDYITYARLGIY